MNSTTLTSRTISSSRLTLRFIVGVLITLGLALLFFYWLMRPSMFEMQAMTLFLAFTAGVSVLAGYIAYRSGLLQRPPRISWTLMGGYILASLLTFLNVWMTARLMFASPHDLQLATVLLVFATGIALSLGYFVSAALNDSIAELNRGAQAISRGDLETRVPEAGNNEMAELAQTFNDMAAQLQAADRERRDLENMRRNLVAWAGHDLRTPLASIQAMTEALADGVVDDPDTIQRYLGTMRHDVQALSNLIDDLFDLAQFAAGGLQLDRHPFAAADLISDAVERFSEAATRQEIRLGGVAQPGMALIDIDAQKMERVLANLVDNAIRHTLAGGSVRVQAQQEGEDVRFVVEDTGEGISEADLPHVFDQFYRGEKSRSRATGGSGLGLAIAKAIVEAHDGTIVVENRSEGGARFTFTLPRN
ncbi:MAG: HAMP domain-containing protein [Caldilineales bacterium]|nr:HAMP domain-containing protein [Caldilineales bacterium]